MTFRGVSKGVSKGVSRGSMFCRSPLPLQNLALQYRKGMQSAVVLTLKMLHYQTDSFKRSSGY